MRKECLNRAENNKDCPCPEKGCERHGICCLCVRYHMKSKEYPKSACMR